MMCLSACCVLTLDLCEVLQCGTPVPQFGLRGTGILKRNLVNVVEGHSHPVPLKKKKKKILLSHSNCSVITYCCTNGIYSALKTTLLSL